MQRAIGWVSRRERKRASDAGAVTLADGRTMQVLVTNTSPEGCELHCEDNLPIGEIVTLACSIHGSARARVRWALCGRAGLRFERSDITRSETYE